MTRFPASDPGKAEQIKVGFVPRGVAIDSLGNAWVANALGHPGTREKLALAEKMLKSKVEGHVGSASKADTESQKAQMWIELFEMVSKYPGGDVSMVQPDGTVLPPFDGGKSINGPWGIAVDANGNVFVADTGDSAVKEIVAAGGYATVIRIGSGFSSVAVSRRG